MINNLEKIKQEIIQLYDKCLDTTETFHTKIDVCVVPDYLATLVFNSLDIDIFGFIITIDNYGISHTLLEHGNPISEAKRGQEAIEKEDFIKWIEVVLHPDKILLLENSKRSNLPQIQFEKVIDNKKIVVKEVRTVTSSKKNKASDWDLKQCINLKSPTNRVNWTLPTNYVVRNKPIQYVLNV